MKLKPYVTFLIILCFTLTSFAQNDSLKQKRLKPLLITSSVVYAGTLVALNQLWYSDFEHQSFQFFDDSQEWKQMDKMGHFYAGFQLSNFGNRSLTWAGLEERKALIWGTVFSAIALTPIEIFDGFSAAYGASYTDLIANTSGAAFFYFQQKHWKEVRIHPKFSFHRTSYPQQRPDLLGENLGEQIVKDYNGQTYWLSFDLSRFFQNGVPKWLNIAIGYSAEGMVSARDHQNELLGYNPQRRFFLAVDFDFNEYSSRSKVVNQLIKIVNLIHLPAPALEFNNKLKFHLGYH